MFPFLPWANGHLLCSIYCCVVYLVTWGAVTNAFTHYQFHYNLWGLKSIARIGKYKLNGLFLWRTHRRWSLCLYNIFPAFKPSGNCTFKLTRSKDCLVPSTHEEKESVKHLVSQTSFSAFYSRKENQFIHSWCSQEQIPQSGLTRVVMH